MSGRYQEGYVQGFRKAQADAGTEIARLREEISLLARKINDLDTKTGSEEITIGCRCGWTGVQSALLRSWDSSLHCPKCGDSSRNWLKCADPVQHPWGGAF